MAADDDPQGVGQERPDGSLGPWPEAAIPDDISELAADVEAYRAQQRAAARRVARARRRARAHPLWRWAIPREKPIAPGFTGAAPHRLLLPLAVTGIALLLCAVVTVLLTTFAPRFDHNQRGPAPLATGVGVYPSDPRGLLPQMQVVGGNGVRRDVRDMRPAVVLMVPSNCGCDARLRTLVQDAQAQAVETDAVVPDTPSLQDAANVTGLSAYRDGSGRLKDAAVRAVSQRGTAVSTAPQLFAVIVDTDGRVLDTLAGSDLGGQLTDRLQQLFATR